MQFRRALGQQAHQIDRDIAVADDHDAPAHARGLGPRETVPRPRHRAGPVHTDEILARDAQPAVARQAGRQHHRVIGRTHRIERDIAAQRDMALKADALAFEQSLELADDALCALMIRRDAIANQPVRHGQRVENGDVGVRAGLGQRLGDIAARRAGSEDRDAGHQSLAQGCGRPVRST